MKRPFEVGERVAVYGCDNQDWFWEGERVTIRSIDGPRAFIQFKDHKGSLVHLKQLRRLKKKEHRAVWLHNLDTTGALVTHARILYEDPFDPEYIEFREVKRK